MYHVSAQGVDERMINGHYYYYSVCVMCACMHVCMYLCVCMVGREGRQLYGVFYCYTVTAWPKALFFLLHKFSVLLLASFLVRELVCFKQVLIPYSLLCNEHCAHQRNVVIIIISV